MLALNIYMLHWSRCKVLTFKRIGIRELLYFGASFESAIGINEILLTHLHTIVWHLWIFLLWKSIAIVTYIGPTCRQSRILGSAKPVMDWLLWSLDLKQLSVALLSCLMLTEDQWRSRDSGTRWGGTSTFPSKNTVMSKKRQIKCQALSSFKFIRTFSSASCCLPLTPSPTTQQFCTISRTSPSPSRGTGPRGPTAVTPMLKILLESWNLDTFKELKIIAF